MIHTGDCITVMAAMPADSVDAVVTDPPYGLEFMGKGWDKPWKKGDDVNADAGFGKVEMADGYERLPMPSFTGSTNPKCLNCGGTQRGRRDGTAERKVCTCSAQSFPNVRWAEMFAFQSWCAAWGREALRVTRPGGYLLAFGGGRTHHRLTSGLEDAGWVIRETLVWIYASGFAKSRNVSRDLEQAVPEGVRCACAPHSTRTALGSQDGYRPERGSGDAPLPQNVGSGLASAPLRGGARGHSRGGPGADDPVLGLEHSPDPASSGHPSIESLPDPASPRSAELRASDSEPSGKPSSTSDSQDGSGDGRSPRHTPSTERSGDDSGAASWSPPRGDAFPYSKCTSCGGWQTAQGWGTALKPAAEYIVMARKPLVGNVAANVAQYGTGAINVDGTRIGTEAMVNPPGLPGGNSVRVHDGGDGRDRDNARRYAELSKTREPTTSTGRWPSSVLLSDPELFDVANPGVVGSGAVSTVGLLEPHHTMQGRRFDPGGPTVDERHSSGTFGGDSGGYSRFFLIPKSSRSDREPAVIPDGHDRTKRFSTHPTQKPTDLMAHLIKLVTPPGGVILDPFLGSGSTAIAAERLGVEWIGIEKEPEYVAIAEARLNGVQRGLGLDVPAPTRKRGSGPTGMEKGHHPDDYERHSDKGWSGGWADTPVEEPA